jgi:hypothetical protein
VTEIGERALDSVITPGRILLRHAKHQIGDFLRDARPTRHLGLDGQAYPMFVGESKPLPYQLLLEYTILLD